MTAVIEIENGLVSVIERSVQAQVPMKDWLDTIQKRYPIFTPVLPVGTRAVMWDQTDLTAQKLVVLIEVAPHTMRMDFMHDIHTLSVPYTRFFFYATTSDPTNSMAWRLDDYRVFWSKYPYRDPDKADMIRALLPNVYGDGRICFGSTAANMNQNLAERLQQTVNEFFVSRFNRDLTIERPNGARTWRQWERMTEKDPTGWMKWPDLDIDTPIRQLFSFNGLMGSRDRSIDRLTPMIAAEPIPPVPMGATFGRLQEWLDALGDTPEANSQRDRLLQAMLTDRAIHNERYETEVLIEEDEDDLTLDERQAAAVEAVAR